MSKVVVKQSQIKKKFKARAMKAKNHLPFGWINSFIAKFPEYKNEKRLVFNVANGLSYDEAVTVKLEELVEALKPTK